MRRALMAVAGALVLAATFVVSEASPAAAAGGLSPAEKKEIEQIVREYLLANPDVLVDSLRVYEERQRKTAEKDARGAIAANRDDLERDGASPVAGNPQGDVTVVEFFDYRCGYCKKALPAIQELLKSDPKVRWVFRDFPILGQDSVVAAQYALAAWTVAPDKYLPFHVALMESRGEMTEPRVLEIARKVGLDINKLKQARENPEVKDKIDRTYDLARKLQINGTPAFIVGSQLIPGAVDLATLRQLVAAARAG